MKFTTAICVAGITLGALIGPAHAQVLGSVLNQVTSTVNSLGGTSESSTNGGVNGVASVNNGNAGGSEPLNVGIGDGGSGSGNVLGVVLGRDSSLATANIGRNGNSAGTELNLLGGNSLLAGIDLGDLDLDLGDIGGGGGGAGTGTGGPGGVADDVLVASLGLATEPHCSIDNGRQVLQIAADRNYTRSIVNSWKRIANVTVVPVRLCAETRRQISSIFKRSNKMTALQATVADDAFLAAALDRAGYDVGNVFAVDKKGNQLTIYVF